MYEKQKKRMWIKQWKLENTKIKKSVTRISVKHLILYVKNVSYHSSMETEPDSHMVLINDISTAKPHRKVWNIQKHVYGEN